MSGRQSSREFGPDGKTMIVLPAGQWKLQNQLVMTLKHLKWIAIVTPLVVVVLLELARTWIFGDLSLFHRLSLDGIVIAGIIVFQTIIFRYVGGLQHRLERQNEELLALHDAGLDIAAELSLDAVLKKVVDRARSLVGAKYGALSVINDAGTIRAFITSGISDEDRAKIGPPPVGHGVLGVVLNEGQTLRLPDLSKHPRSVGFPANHPHMSSLVAVPVPCKGPFRGNLYLAEKSEGSAFSAADEETLARFAVQAAIAIDNAHLHEQVADLAAARERLRIAHEMHDGLAQVLGFVNTKAQAVHEYLKRGKVDQASAQVTSLAESARDAYTDVRESIVALRSIPDTTQSLDEVVKAYVDRWKEQNDVTVHLTLNGDLHLRPGLELQVIRILQEALANVRKHAHADQVTVEIKRDHKAFELRVEDDGVGINSSANPARSEHPRFGLTTMKERAESIGGTLRIEPRPNGGTVVQLHLPLEQSI